ncbi:MAG: GNAT family N-acetyltransferase, partial [Actinomycetales bacterium]|nr:GNAT family N-acetyltransferase [Actinomycetales bacterium]
MLLRAQREGDLDRIVEQCRDPESVRWTTVPVPYGPEDARSFLELVARGWEQPGGPRVWAIAAADDP